MARGQTARAFGPGNCDARGGGQGILEDMIQGAIFDVDGTLLNTMRMWRNVAVKYLAQLGVTVNPELGARFFEMTLPESAQLMREEFQLPYSVHEIMEGIHAAAANAYRQECQLMPGAGDFVRALHARQIPMTIVSSGSEDLIRAALSRLGLEDCFRAVFASTQTGLSKREDTMFLQAAAVMGSRPEETWVFEDAPYAVRVAKAAGFRAIGIADENTRGYWDQLRAETEDFWYEYPSELPSYLLD